MNKENNREIKTNGTNMEELPSLTENQKEIYKAFHNRENWKPPSYRDVADIVGKENVNSIANAIRIIERKGYEIPKGNWNYKN